MASSAERSRGEHVPQPSIESLPWIGRTWYHRGFSYWARRAALSLLLLGLAALDVAILGWILVPMLRNDYQRPAGIVLLTVVVVAGIAMGVWVWRRDPNRDRASSRRAVALGGAGGAAGAFSAAAGGIGAVLIPLAALITVGPMLVYFIRSLTPVPFLERKARERLRSAG
jgi:uncharacterized membrane protein YfcA